MQNKITQTEWEQAEALDRRRQAEKRIRNTPTSNLILDGTTYLGGYGDYTPYDSGSTSCDSSPSTSCD